MFPLKMVISYRYVNVYQRVIPKKLNSFNPNCLVSCIPQLNKSYLLNSGSLVDGQSPKSLLVVYDSALC